MLLKAIGMSPVNSLEESHPDVETARSTLHRVRKSVQQRGWWFNIDYNVTYTPDNVGHIDIPSFIYNVVPLEPTYVMRGSKLYDTENNTYVFTDDVIISTQVKILEWADMHETLQDYCAYYAAAQYVREELEDTAKEDSFKADAGIAMLQLRDLDLEAGQYNVFDNARVARARGGVRPYNLGRN